MVKYNYDLDLVFNALADPTRRIILRQIIEGEKRVTELAKPFKMSLAAVSKHLKVLEKARLINRRKQGREYYMSFNHEALLSADKWISLYRTFWEDQLDSLEEHLSQNHTREK